MIPPQDRPVWSLPVDWTPQQVLAVHEALNTLLSALWLHYDDVLREHFEQDPVDPTAHQLELFDFDDPLPF
jgi:hypothetical protein